MLKGNDHINNLRDLLSKEICLMLKDRINLLGKEGLLGLWMKPNGNDFFNAGTLLFYSDNEWELIKKYSGLWNLVGKIQNDSVWLKKLNPITTERRYAQTKFDSGNNLWFRITNNLTSSDGKVTPTDDINEKRTLAFIENIKNKRLSPADRLSPSIYEMISTIVNDSEEEDDIEIKNIKIGNYSTTLEMLFFESDIVEQESLIQKFLLINKVYKLF